MNKLEKQILGSLIKFSVSTTTAHSVTITAKLYIVYSSKVWVSFSRITFQHLREEIAKFHCTASSFHNILHLVHNKVQEKLQATTL